MSNCNTITYRLKRNVQPAAVLGSIYDLLNRYNLSHSRCLWSLSNYVDNSTNGYRDSILKIKQDYPQLAECYRNIGTNYGETHRIINYQEPDLIPIHPGYEESIRNIICRIPQFYHINNLEFYIDGINFSDKHGRIRENPSGFGPPVGSYIAYIRESCADERHSYIILATEYNGTKQPDLFRDFFFELAQLLPGKYEGTQVIFE